MKDKTTSQWLEDQQALAGVTDEALASALGYESPKVIQMFKSGDMKVPINKVPVLADALDLNPGLLMRRVLNDVNPEMLHAVEHCLGALSLSKGEQKLIAAIRKANPSKEPVPIMFDRDAIITLVVA